MIITTMCILVLRDSNHRKTAWHCDGVGYVVSRNTSYLGFDLQASYPFDVRIDENGDKILVLRKEKQNEN